MRLIASCLIADRDGVYDAGSANGRLLLGLKGTISELELHTLRGRLTAGLLAKAARGELALQLPAGLRAGSDGRGHQGPRPGGPGPDRPCVRHLPASAHGDGRRAHPFMTARGLTLPRRDRHGDIRWRPPTIAAVVGMLKNPGLRRRFVYGRTRQRPSAAPGRRPLRTPAAAVDEWTEVRRDGTSILPISTGMTFEKIQAMLSDNRADYHTCEGPRHPARRRRPAARHRLVRRVRP